MATLKIKALKENARGVKEAMETAFPYNENDVTGKECQSNVTKFRPLMAFLNFQLYLFLERWIERYMVYWYPGETKDDFGVYEDMSPDNPEYQAKLLELQNMVFYAQYMISSNIEVCGNGLMEMLLASDEDIIALEKWFETEIKERGTLEK